MLLQVDDGTGSLLTVGGLRSTGITFNDEMVDVTNKDSKGIREVLAGAGVQSVTISGSGIFTDALSENDVIDAGQKQGNTTDGSTGQTAAFRPFKVIIPGLGAFTNTNVSGRANGGFMITSLEYAGEYNGEVTYSLTLESTGYVTFTTA